MCSINPFLFFLNVGIGIGVSIGMAVSYYISSGCVSMEQTRESHAKLSMLGTSRRNCWEVEVKHFTFYFQHFGIV